VQKSSAEFKESREKKLSLTQGISPIGDFEAENDLGQGVH